MLATSSYALLLAWASFAAPNGKKEFLILKKASLSPQAVLLLGLFSIVRQDIPGTLKKVVSKKEPSQRMLNTATHLHQVFQDIFPGLREGLHIDDAYSY